MRFIVLPVCYEQSTAPALYRTPCCIVRRTSILVLVCYTVPVLCIVLYCIAVTVSYCIKIRIAPSGRGRHSNHDQ
jgi:hypothetical protein